MSTFGKIVLLNLWCYLSCTESSYVQPLKTSPGLFYEQVGRIKYYNSNMDVVVFVSLSEIHRSVELSYNIYEKMYKLCIKSKHDYSTTLPSLKLKMDSIKKKSQSVYELLSKNHETQRVKRWWDRISPSWNFISGFFKGIKDSKKYDEIIQTMNKNNLTFKFENYKKIEAIKSSIFSFNETMQQILNNQNIMKSRLEGIEKGIGNKWNSVNFKKMINREFLIFRTTLDLIDNQCKILTDVVGDAQKGVIHSEIMTNSEILKHLQKTVEYNQPHMQYMFPLSQDFIDEIIKVATIQVYYYNFQLVYIIQNPVGENVIYNQYRLIPLPARRSDKSYVFIQPKTKYLAIDDNMLQYIAFDDNNGCKKTKNLSVCELNQPLTPVHGSSNCETELLLTPSSIPKSCDIMVTYNEYEILHSMKAQNTWLFVFSNPQDASFICPKSPAEHVVLENIGVLRIPKGCSLRTNKKIIPASIYNSSNSSIIPLKADILMDERCKNSLKIRSQGEILKTKYLVESTLDDLKMSSKNIEEHDDGFPNRTNLIYMIVGLVLATCIIMLLIYLYFKHRIVLIESNNAKRHESRILRIKNRILKKFRCSNINKNNRVIIQKLPILAKPKNELKNGRSKELTQL